jgi:hypothetical protein
MHLELVSQSLPVMLVMLVMLAIIGVTLSMMHHLPSIKVDIRNSLCVTVRLASQDAEAL